MGFDPTRGFFVLMKFPVRFIVVLVLAGCLLAPWRPLRVIAMLDLLLLLPAWVLVARERLIPALGLAAAVSPVLVGAVMLPAMLAGATPHFAAWAAVAVWAVVFLVFGGGRTRFDGAEIRIARAMLAVAVVAGVLVFALPLTSEWWRVREDSWFHAAVLQHIVHHGVPPCDPYFTPLRLQYMYYYHVILSGVSAGAARHAALRFTERIEGGNIVVMFSDGGWKYLPARPWRDAAVAEPCLDEVHWW